MLSIYKNLLPDLGAFSTHNGIGKTPMFGEFNCMKRISEIPIGEKFGRLTILEEVEPKCRYDKKGRLKKIRMVRCLCDCGNIIITRYCELIRGGTKSCSCLRGEMAKISQKKTFTKHGLSKNGIVKLLGSMKTRCYNEKCKSFKDYGLRGIIVCDEWLNDTLAFYNWAINNGYKKGLQIDRIDNDGNYEPTNCRWVTKKEQARNRRTNRWLEYNGERMLISDWAIKLGVNFTSLWGILKRKNTNEAIEYYINKNKNNGKL